MSQRNESTQRCLDLCRDCFIVCQETISSCLKKGGKHAAADHIALLQSCALVCQTSASLMAINSSFDAEHCELCSRVCEQCAQQCDRFGDDKEMTRCADTCRECAEACRKMDRSASAA